MLETDYLVVGAGAAGMAFTDEVLTHTEREVVLVDRRHQPGGHWLDAYPFVTLHLPSAFYGVNSRPLGADRIDDTGLNAGLYERASGDEIRDYYRQVLHERFLPSGRVRFLGMHEFETSADGRHRITSHLTGERQEVVVRRKLVDATYLEASVPATHQPNFEMEPGVRFVAINELPQLRLPAARYVVIGAGKTGHDACVWLLQQGVPPGRIRWVRSRDGWFLERSGWQPLELLPSLMEGFSRELDALAQATSLDDLFARLEACGRLVRLDPSVVPTMYHCATVGQAELTMLRSITDVVRFGRVRRIGLDRLDLEQGSVPAEPTDVYVDCSAVGLRRPPERPVFEPDRITLQQVRYCSPTFNAALAGFIESTRDDVEAQNRLCPVSTYPDEPLDWLRVLVTTQTATAAWRSEPDLLQWLESSRLNMLRGLGAHADDPRMQEALQRYAQNLRPALQKIGQLLLPVQTGAVDEPTEAGSVR